MKKVNKYLEYIEEQREMEYLLEGIDIDSFNKMVYFNDDHEKNINTSIYTNPTISHIKDIKVISIFKRIRNDEKTDGNPLIYALKDIKGWKIDDANLEKLYNRFNQILEKINDKYDTIILVPSSNILNTKILHNIGKTIKYDHQITDYMQKMSADDVYDNYIDWKSLYTDFPNRNLKKIINDSFLRMETENDDIFSFKYIPTNYRSYITKTMNKNYSVIKYAEEINDKHILILDDTISSGNTISEMSEDIITTYIPKSITILTLFSSL